MNVLSQAKQTLLNVNQYFQKERIWWVTKDASKTTYRIAAAPKASETTCGLPFGKVAPLQRVN